MPSVTPPSDARVVCLRTRCSASSGTRLDARESLSRPARAPAQAWTRPAHETALAPRPAPAAGSGRARPAATSCARRAGSSSPAPGSSGPRSASRRMGVAIPDPIVLIATPSSVTKPRKTATMIAAAAVIARLVDAGPRATLRGVSGALVVLAVPREQERLVRPSTGRTRWRTSSSAATSAPASHRRGRAPLAPAPARSRGWRARHAASTADQVGRRHLEQIATDEHHHQQSGGDCDDEADQPPDPVGQMSAISLNSTDDPVARHRVELRPAGSVCPATPSHSRAARTRP